MWIQTPESVDSMRADLSGHNETKNLESVKNVPVIQLKEPKIRTRTVKMLGQNPS